MNHRSVRFTGNIVGPSGSSHHAAAAAHLRATVRLIAANIDDSVMALLPPSIGSRGWAARSTCAGYDVRWLV